MKNLNMAVAEFFVLFQIFTLLISKTGNIKNELLLLSAMPTLIKMSGTSLTLLHVAHQGLGFFFASTQNKERTLVAMKAS